MSWEKQTALGIVGLAAFQLVDMWSKNAPTLQTMRAAPPGDLGCKQQLMDATLLVSGFVVIVGGGFWVMTGDGAPLLILALSLGFLTLWYHQVLAADSLSPDILES